MITATIPGLLRLDHAAAYAEWDAWTKADPATRGPCPQPTADSFGLDPVTYWNTGPWVRIPGFEVTIPDPPTSFSTGFGIFRCLITGRCEGTRQGEIGLLATIPRQGQPDFVCDYGVWPVDLGAEQYIERIVEWGGLPGAKVTAWARQICGHEDNVTPYSYPGLPFQGAAGWFELADVELQADNIPNTARIKPPDAGDGTYCTTAPTEAMYAEVITQGDPLLLSSDQGWQRIAMTPNSSKWYQLDASIAQHVVVHVSPTTAIDPDTGQIAVPGTVLQSAVLISLPGQENAKPIADVWSDTLGPSPLVCCEHIFEFDAPSGPQTWGAFCCVLPGPNGETRVVPLTMVLSLQGGVTLPPRLIPSGRRRIVAHG